MQFFQQDRLQKNKKGFSLIEILLIVAAAGIIIILMDSLPNSINLISKSRQQSVAREIMTKIIEDKRSIAYINLSNTLPEGENITDPRLSLLPAASGKIKIIDCQPSICTNAENAKQVTVTINWTTQGKPQMAKIDTIISEGGLNQ